MHIVYLIKLKREELPNSYIGVKSNCRVENNKIYDKHNKIYEGSSTCKNFKELKKLYDYDVIILGEFNNYKDALDFERMKHIENDVVASPIYFNKSISQSNNYTNPNYATYKNILTNKKARLPRDHPEVLNGNWVGITKGIKSSPDVNDKRKRFGQENGFYGKHHDEKTLKLLSEKAKQRGRTSWDKRSPESKQRWIDAVSRPLSEEHKKNISIAGKGCKMLQNIHTLEIIKAKPGDPRVNDPDWVNPKKIKPDRKIKCKYCDMISSVGNINRWHNENCRNRGNNENIKN